MITFNSVSSTAYADILTVMRVNRPLYPGAAANTVEIPDRDGVYYFGKDKNPVSISFRLSLNSASATARRTAIRQIAAWLENDDPKPLSFNDESTLIYYSVLTEPISVDEFALTGFADVRFTVPDGCAYSTGTETVSDVATTAVTSTNAGTLPCDCVITVSPTTDYASLKLTLDATSEYLELNSSGGSTNEIIFNTQRRTVTVDGTDASSGIDYDSTWFKLPVGAFTIDIDGAASDVDIVYRERWM